MAVPASHAKFASTQTGAIVFVWRGSPFDIFRKIGACLLMDFFPGEVWAIPAALCKMFFSRRARQVAYRPWPSAMEDCD